MSVIAINKHRFWPTGHHKFNTNDVTHTAKIDENYTAVHLQGRAQALVVAMHRTELQNLITSANMKNTTADHKQSAQDTQPTAPKNTTQKPKRHMRKIHRRR